jgi:hypothetical protein
MVERCKLWVCPECERIGDRMTRCSQRTWRRIAKDPTKPPKCRQHMRLMRLVAS